MKTVLQVDEETIIVTAIENMVSDGRFTEAASVLTGCVCALADGTTDPQGFIDEFHRIATLGMGLLQEEGK